jgi:hypothetical protein
MSQQLLAFRLAKPAEALTDTGVDAVYDPATQMSWYGGSRPLAVSCFHHCCAFRGALGCNAYGSYCTLWNYSSQLWHYHCRS